MDSATTLQAGAAQGSNDHTASAGFSAIASPAKELGLLPQPRSDSRVSLRNVVSLANTHFITALPPMDIKPHSNPYPSMKAAQAAASALGLPDTMARGLNEVTVEDQDVQRLAYAVTTNDPKTIKDAIDATEATAPEALVDIAEEKLKKLGQKRQNQGLNPTMALTPGAM